MIILEVKFKSNVNGVLEELRGDDPGNAVIACSLETLPCYRETGGEVGKGLNLLTYMGKVVSVKAWSCLLGCDTAKNPSH
jgi:hypothetical protein